MSAWLTPTLAAIAALSASLVAWLVAVRRFSGRIGTTEAADLWREASAMREEYREEIDRLNAVIASLRKRILELEEDNVQLHRENVQLKRRVEEVSNGES